MARSQTELIEVRNHAPLIERMRREVLHGLSQAEKFLPSKYLYDERGAKLFERICEQDEYYPTRVETDILRAHATEISSLIGPGALLIEPGSGSGIKTRLLLAALDRPAGYVPIDMSLAQLSAYAEKLRADLPRLAVLPVCADFADDFEIPHPPRATKRRVVFFPGSTIGNTVPEEAVRWLERMSRLAGADGAVVIGVDLRKDPAILEPAYDDAAGVSAEFALNYLKRLNRELDADFDVDKFRYYAFYDQSNGRIEMYVVSECDQTVRLGDHDIDLRAHERIRTEYAYKYSLESFADITRRAGLSVRQVWTDAKQLFSVQYLCNAGE